jgi:hypothetical protein
VEPEVYWSKAKVLLVAPGFRQSCAALLTTLSVANQRIVCSSGACANKPSSLERIDDVVSASTG